MNLQEWIDCATGAIPRQEERNAAASELLDHYADCVDALLARGLEEEEAKTQALAALGDALETRRLMRRVHNAALVRALWAMRVLLFLVAFFFLFAGQPWVRVADWVEAKQEEATWIGGRAGEENWPLLAASRQGSCDRTGQIGELRLSVSAAWTLHRQTMPQDEGWGQTVNETTYLVLKVAAPPWVHPSPETLGLNLRLTDETGREFHLARERDWDSIPENCFYLRQLCRGLTGTTFLVSLYYPCDPDRLTLTYEDRTQRETLSVVFGPRTLTPDFPTVPLDERAEGALIEASRIDWGGPALPRDYAARSASLALEVPLTSASSWQEEGEPTVYTFNFLALLRGPGDLLPLDVEDLMAHMTLTDDLGRSYGLVPDGAHGFFVNGEERLYSDGVAYSMYLRTDEAARTFTLTYDRGGERLTLELDREEAQP